MSVLLAPRPFAIALATLLIWVAPRAARSEVRLPAIVSDHMVLQSDVEIPVWGWADAGENVAVKLGEATARATAEDSGRWMVRLPPLKAGGPHQLEVQGQNRLTVQDVLIGEVWLGSGQSNMAMTVNRALRPEEEAREARFDQIRMFTVTSGAADQPQDDCKGEWLVCSPETVSRFSATAYFFGRSLHQELKVPVGLINSSVGGTPIESWISPEALRDCEALQPLLADAARETAEFDEERAKSKYARDLAKWQQTAKQAKSDGKPVPRRPIDPIAQRQRKGNLGGLFQGKIAPLVPYRIRGAIWYQGEANSNASKAPYYHVHLPLLIQDWRARWGYEFPFAWVQLPNYGAPGREWPVVREAMRKTLSVPHTGMAITIDLGETKDIHPKNKQDVGKRLAQWALAEVYDKHVVASGPLPASAQRRGASVVVSFEHADGGLTSKDGSIAGFELAGPDGYQPAEARIEKDRVIVSHPEIPKPTAVRYLWQNDPTPSLFNGAQLPASPFELPVE